MTVSPCDIYLPDASVDPAAWSVIACDQYTQSPAWWEGLKDSIGNKPSTLDLILPEAFLSDEETRVPLIHRKMREYLDRGILQPRVRQGFVYVRRNTTGGVREGLVAAIDLDQYDPSPLWQGPIRATEGVVPERVPPRAFIRRGAPVELPHVLMLLDDPADALFSYLREEESLPTLYDFDLMKGCGHITGRAVEKDAADRVNAILSSLSDASNGLFLVVGDGNHSLAAAKAVREEYRATLSEEEFPAHPSRWALVEIGNLHDPSLTFEPIYRILYGVTKRDVLSRLPADAQPGGNDFSVLSQDGESFWSVPCLPVKAVQDLTDRVLREVPHSSVDYIHGKDALLSLVDRPDRVALLPRVTDKEELFPYVRCNGPLPRKSFSMGEAQDKRCYMEARLIR